MTLATSTHLRGDYGCMAGERSKYTGTGVVWAPPHLPCDWELNILHNDLVNQGWNEGKRDRAGKSVVRATV